MWNWWNWWNRKRAEMILEKDGICTRHMKRYDALFETGGWVKRECPDCREQRMRHDIEQKDWAKNYLDFKEQ
jgi:hypothetical protein